MKKLIQFFLPLVIVSCGPDIDFGEELLVPVDPNAVELLFPERNSECTTGQIISETESEVPFDWTDADIGDYYEITLLNLLNGVQSTYNSETSDMAIVIQRGAPYSWKVTTVIEETEATVESNTEYFYNAGPGVEAHVPFPAENPVPSSGTVLPGSTSTVDISWDGNDLDNDIVEYDFFFGTTQSPGLFEANLNSNSISTVPVNRGTTYYWKVLTRDSVGNESYSDVFFFSVE